MQVAGAMDTNALARKYSFCTRKTKVAHIMPKVATKRIHRCPYFNHVWQVIHIMWIKPKVPVLLQKVLA